MRSGHVLAIGATGMLAGAVRVLAGSARTVTLVARGARRLAAAAREARAAGAEAIEVRADYTDLDGLLPRLRAEIETAGVVDRALLWIHGSAPRAPAALIALLEETSPGARAVLVLGSAAADPSADLPARLDLLGARQVELRAAVLGFVREGGASRWLADEEICAGVLAALAGEERIRIVGTVEPWSARP